MTTSNVVQQGSGPEYNQPINKLCEWLTIHIGLLTVECDGMPLDNPDELFVQVDENDEVTGPVKRGKDHTDPTIIHRAAGVLVFNDKNHILLQKRSKHKDLYPGLWAVSAAGHVTYGDDYKVAAIKEMKEELGVEGKLEKIKKYYYQKDQETEMVMIYKTIINETPTNYDRDEVDEVLWVDVEKLTDFVSKNTITPIARMVFEDLGYINK